MLGHGQRLWQESVCTGNAARCATCPIAAAYVAAAVTIAAATVAVVADASVAVAITATAAADNCSLRLLCSAFAAAAAAKFTQLLLLLLWLLLLLLLHLIIGHVGAAVASAAGTVQLIATRRLGARKEVCCRCAGRLEGTNTGCCRCG